MHHVQGRVYQFSGGEYPPTPCVGPTSAGSPSLFPAPKILYEALVRNCKNLHWRKQFDDFGNLVTMRVIVMLPLL